MNKLEKIKHEYSSKRGFASWKDLCLTYRHNEREIAYKIVYSKYYGDIIFFISTSIITVIIVYLLMLVS